MLFALPTFTSHRMSGVISSGLESSGFRVVPQADLSNRSKAPSPSIAPRSQNLRFQGTSTARIIGSTLAANLSAPALRAFAALRRQLSQNEPFDPCLGSVAPHVSGVLLEAVPARFFRG